MVGSNTLLEVNGKRVRGRLYPWGVVEGGYTPLPLPKLTDSKSLLHQWSIIHECVFLSLIVENKDHCDFTKLRDMLIK